MFRTVLGSLWWLVREIGLGFGPAPRAGHQLPFGPRGLMLVFGVRIEVVNSPFSSRVRVRIGLGLGLG